MSSAKNQLETAATGITFEQLRADYWRAHNQPERADRARRELQKWQARYESAWLTGSGEQGAGAGS